MSTENSNTRTAYLRINHPTETGVFEVVTIEQAILIPATTTIPAYTFNWDPGDPIEQSISGLSWNTSFEFEWDGPQDLGPGNFELNGVGPSDGGLVANLPQISYNVDGTGGTVTTTFTRNSAGTSLFDWVFTYPSEVEAQTGTVTGQQTQQLALTFTSVSTGPGGPGGCHLAGTEILMSDGTTKLVEELVAGDMVVSYGLNGLSQEEEAWLEWSTTDNDFAATAGTSEVKSIGINQYNAYRKINTSVKDDHIRITYEHPVLVNRSGEIRYMSVRHLQSGDKLYYRYDNGTAGWIDFLSMETVQTEDVFTTYTLDVEAEDSYLANGLVAHNIVPEGPTDFIDAGDGKGNNFNVE
jgi:hypothetical protein